MNFEQSFNLQTYAHEKVSLPFQPEVPQFAQFQGELSHATWFTAVPGGTPLPAADEEDDDFSTATYVFFHIGWIFLVVAVGFMIAGPLFGFAWTWIAVGSALLISAVSFRQCLVQSNHDQIESLQAGR